MMNVQSGTNQDMSFLSMKDQTIGHILCCKCGTSILPNNVKMCVSCLTLKTRTTDSLPTHVSIIHCSYCKSYLHPPTTWLKAELESKELLSFCLGKLKKLKDYRLIDAKFVHTEPHSKKIKLRIRVQTEVLNQVYVEKSHDIEYVIVDRICQSCTSLGKPEIWEWEAVVQARQYVSHMRTFFHLVDLIVKHKVAISAVKIKRVDHGIDFFFPNKRDALRLFNFLCCVVSIKPQYKSLKQLMSLDTKSNNITRSKYNIVAVISPICRDDLVYVPPKLSSRFRQIGPLAVCIKARSNITLLNPLTLNHCVIDSDQYWRSPFDPLLTSKELVEYIVLDVVVVSCQNDADKSLKYTLADVETARVLDFGKNDRIISVRTHLGHLLKPGDCALGYDLYGSNFNNSEAEEGKELFPDAILIKKKCPEKQKRKTSKGIDVVDSEYHQFLRDLETDPEKRFNISLHNTSASEDSSHGMDVVSFNQLKDVFADLAL